MKIVEFRIDLNSSLWHELKHQIEMRLWVNMNNNIFEIYCVLIFREICDKLMELNPNDYKIDKMKQMEF